MLRTQVYLSTEQAAALKALAARSGKSQSELIRQAVEALTVKQAPDHWRQTLKHAAGMWRDRNDLPDFAALRQEWDRLNG